MVSNTLEAEGYHVDFETGRATNDGGKNQQRIGKLLNKLEYEDLAERWSDAKGQYMKDAMIVVSRNPKDIARASTARDWTSCMDETNLEHPEAHWLKQDVEHGTTAVYLTTTDDPELQDPKSRIFLKPYHNEKGETALIPCDHHGLEIDAFNEAVEQLSVRYNQGLEGCFRKDLRLYQGEEAPAYNLEADGNKEPIDFLHEVEHYPEILPEHLRTGECSAEELLGYFDIEIQVDEHGQAYVDEDIELNGIGLQKLPDMSHIQARGAVSIFNNPITSLEGAPECEALHCGGTDIQNLEGGHPHTERIYCSYTPHMTSLEGAPDGLTHLQCNESSLPSFEGMPESLEMLHCNKTPARDFEHLPDGTRVIEGRHEFIHGSRQSLA